MPTTYAPVILKSEFNRTIQHHHPTTRSPRLCLSPVLKLSLFHPPIYDTKPSSHNFITHPIYSTIPHITLPYDHSLTTFSFVAYPRHATHLFSFSLLILTTSCFFFFPRSTLASTLLILYIHPPRTCAMHMHRDSSEEDDRTHDVVDGLSNSPTHNRATNPFTFLPGIHRAIHAPTTTMTTTTTYDESSSARTHHRFCSSCS